MDQPDDEHIDADTALVKQEIECEKSTQASDVKPAGSNTENKDYVPIIKFGSKVVRTFRSTTPRFLNCPAKSITLTTNQKIRNAETNALIKSHKIPTSLTIGTKKIITKKLTSFSNIVRASSAVPSQDISEQSQMSNISDKPILKISKMATSMAKKSNKEQIITTKSINSMPVSGLTLISKILNKKKSDVLPDEESTNVTKTSATSTTASLLQPIVPAYTTTATINTLTDSILRTSAETVKSLNGLSSSLVCTPFIYTIPKLKWTETTISNTTVMSQNIAMNEENITKTQCVETDANPTSTNKSTNKIIISSVKSLPTESVSVSSITKLPLFPGLRQIPKDTIVKQFVSKDLATANKEMKNFVTSANTPPSLLNKSSVTIIKKPSNGKSYSNIFNISPTKDTNKQNNKTHESVQSNTATNIFPSKELTVSMNKIDKLPTIENFKNSKMASVHIFNGKITDPRGLIKLLGLNKEQCASLEERLEKSKNDQIFTTLSNTIDSIAMLKPVTNITNPNINTQNNGNVVTKKMNVQGGQSLLINKILENVKKSPRLQKRSKSLTTINKKPRKIRRARIPSAPTISRIDTIVEPQIEPIKSSNLCVDNTNLSNLCDSLFDTLECTEKLDDSEKIKSASPNENKESKNLIGSKSFLNEIAKSKPMQPENLEQNLSINRENPLKLIKWRSGIGYLCKSNVHFKMNEFGLVDLLDEKDFTRDRIDTAFERSLNNEKELNMNKNIAFWYICKVCYKNAPSDICSIECSAKYNADKLNSSTKDKNKLSAKLSLLKKSLSIDMSQRQQLFTEPLNIKNTFTWEKYLKVTAGIAAPVNLFINPFPSSPNMFEVGMKLEAIDPKHCSLFCVCTIVDKFGYRIKLNFDGYGKEYDFWKNADSLDIFPPGWCAKTGRQLQPPPGFDDKKFDWYSYMVKTKAQGAPRMYFTHLNSTTTADNPFKIGMKLEVNDQMNREFVCVASIADVIDNRILIKYDGYNDSYKYWTDITSPYIHPVNWHQKNGCNIFPPPDFRHGFSWSNYLKSQKCDAVPESAFCARNPIGFKTGMKLEIVDKKVPSLIRPATVVIVDNYKIKILFDRWPSSYSFWVDDDNTDIHPINWCSKTEHPIEPPLGFGSDIYKSSCGVLGCREVGNAKHPELGFHFNLCECPYESRNWSSNIKKSRFLEPSSDRKTMHKSLKRKFKTVPNLDQMKRIKAETNSREGSISPDLIIAPIEIKQEIIDDNDNDNDEKSEIEKRIGVSSNLLREYGPNLYQIHKLWKFNSAALKAPRNDTNKNPLCWTVIEVANYVSCLPKCSALRKLFRDEEIDGYAFLSMTQDDLVNHLGLKLGPSIKIYNQIVSLREGVVVNVAKT